MAAADEAGAEGQARSRGEPATAGRQLLLAVTFIRRGRPGHFATIQVQRVKALMAHEEMAPCQRRERSGGVYRRAGPFWPTLALGQPSP